MLDSPTDLLNKAAAPTLERIQRDQGRVVPRLQPMLEYIGEHLFDPQLNVNRLKKACGIRDNSVAIHFHSAVGKPPHAYLSEARLEVATRLLRDSDLPVWKISSLLGFSSIQVFSRAFFRWYGQRPTAYRREARVSSELPPPRDADTSQDYWRRAMSGKLRSEEAAELIQRLLELYPPRRR